jgi:hypothetical protein
MSMTSASGVPRPVPRGNALLARAASADRHALWEHCRNSLGIARLLVQEGRAIELVDTACFLAVDSACRAALFSERAYDGDPGRALRRLAAPRGLWPLEGTAQDRLRGAEAAVGWLAAYLRGEAPEHRWGY